LSRIKALQPKLAIVIHTEEEFDWNGGFYRSNNQVTHGSKLISFCEQLICIGAKITFALDYAFVCSYDGQKVITHFKQSKFQDNIEFATHCHPWVNPPFENNNDKILDIESYPGNLSPELELQKLQLLTDKITEVCGVQPTTYLAGRYGIGKNSNAILKKLGYITDISISPFTNFTHQKGPDFSFNNNDIFKKDGLIHWPHTTAILSLFSSVETWFNKHPEKFEIMQSKRLTRLLMKLLRIKKQRLSPEGFALKDLIKVTNTQLALGKTQLILSFHSPSTKTALTPYVANEQTSAIFNQKTIAYVKWFKQLDNASFILVNESTQ